MQFQLDYFDFRLLNFHLMTSLQCWRIFWHFQISRLTQLGAECDLCKEKLYGDDKKMVEHYATDHNKLEEAIVDPKSVPISTEVTRAVLEQLFPDLLIFV